VLCGFLLACSTLPPGFELEANQAAIHRVSGTVFPVQIGSFFRTELFNYNPSGSDISVNYQKETPTSILIGIYVFPASNAGGPIALQSEHEKWANSIVKSHGAELMESNVDVQIDVRGEAFAAIRSAFSYSDDFAGRHQQLYSVLMELKYKGWFVSYRMSLPIAGKGEALQWLQELVVLAPWPTEEYSRQN
jgi:hypothetical protein